HPERTVIELVITNLGSTLARDVRFEFTPPIASTHDGEAARGPVADLRIFRNGIPSLPPGKKVSIFFDRFPPRLEAELPLTYEVRASYHDGDGRRFEENQVLDLEMYR